MNKKNYDYNNMRLIPKIGKVLSRKECDTSVQFGKFKFGMPVCPANMKSVVDIDTCIFFAKNSFFYIYHRFLDNYINDQIQFCKMMKVNKLFSSISIGVKEIDYKLIDEIKKEKIIPDFLTIDVAHGHSIAVKNMTEYIKKILPEIFLIVGNVCTKEAVKDIEEWGASAIKVGLGCGNPCITYNKTGFGSNKWQASCIKMCSSVSGVPIIADGGIIEHGDIAKAIACGASMVMAGSLFAGYDQSAGRIIEIEDRMYKEYYGSASKDSKIIHKNIEGKKILIQYRGDMRKLLIELKEDLQSSISYAGGNMLENLKGVEYYVINH